MITVDEVIKAGQKTDKLASEQNNEMLRTGKIKAKTQSYWLYIATAALGLLALWAVWRKGKQNDGAISG